MFRDAMLVARKDLRIEVRSRVVTTQVLPFSLLILILFAFALDNLVVSDPGASRQDSIGASTVSSGLFWLAIVFSMLLAIQRSFAIESADNARDGLRLSSLEPSGIFLGKVAALVTELLLLELLLLACTIVFFGAVIDNPLLLVLTCMVGTIGLATVGTLYGALSSGLRSRDTLMPLLFFPAISPLLLGCVQATQDAFTSGSGNGYGWFRLVLAFGATFTVFGVLAFESILEEA
jgi:heme exporter protein B